MENKAYKKGIRVGKFLDFTEHLVVPILHRSTSDLKVIRNLRYGSIPREELDVIRINDNAKRPVLVYVHGGGFISGVRKMRTYICADYARAGYAVFNVDYELAPKKQFPFQLSELFKAIDFIFDNAEKYNADPTNIVVAGESAGAYFASYVAAIIKSKELLTKLGIEFKHKGDIDVRAAVLLNGCYSAKNMCSIKFTNMPTFIESFFGINREDMLLLPDKEALIYSPVEQIEANFPKTVVGRSKADGLDTESLYLIERLKAKGVPYTEFMAGGINSPHGWCLATFTKEGKRCLEHTLDYLK